MTVQSVYEEFYKSYGVGNKRIGQICLVGGILVIIGSLLMGVNKLGIIVGLGLLVISAFGFTYARAFLKNYTPDMITIEEHVVVKKQNRLATTGSHSTLFFDNDLSYEFPARQKMIFDKADVGDKYKLAVLKGSNRALKIELVEKVDPRFINPTIVVMGGNEGEASAVAAAASTNDAISMFKSMMDQEEDEVLLCNLLHKVIYANTAAKEFYGIEVEGKTAFELWDNSEVNEIQKALLAFSEGSEKDRILLSENENEKVYLGAIRDNEKKLTNYYKKVVKK